MWDTHRDSSVKPDDMKSNRSGGAKSQRSNSVASHQSAGSAGSGGSDASKKKKKEVIEEPEEDFSDRISSDKDKMIDIHGYSAIQTQ